MASHPNLEQQLTQELRHAESHYRRALQLLRSRARSNDWHETLELMQPALRELQEIELTLAPVRKDWNASGQRGGSELQALILSQRATLGELLQHIAELEERVKQRRNELAPQLDHTLAHQKMQRAYHQAGSDRR